jgi:hypothetical protein
LKGQLPLQLKPQSTWKGETPMLLASDYDKSKYLKATDLEREKKYRIKAVTPEELKDNTGKTDKKLVLWFTNSEQGLVLNKTNLRTLKGAFGDDTAGWV